MTVGESQPAQRWRTMPKGDRRERQARKLYEKAGYTVQPFYGRPYGETDGFGLFDLVALRGQEPPIFIQVKSNRARGVTDWSTKACEVLPEYHAIAEMVVCYDGEGWRLIQATNGAYRTVYDGRKHDHSMGIGLTDYLSEE